MDDAVNPRLTGDCELIFSDRSDPLQFAKCFACGECFGKDLVKAYAWAFNMERFQNIQPTYSFYLWKSLPDETSRQQAKALASKVHSRWADMAGVVANQEAIQQSHSEPDNQE